MRKQTAYGAILLSGSAVLLVMGVMHPSAIPWGDDAALARLAVIDALAHSLAILGAGLSLLGLVGLSRMLGSHRLPVTAALVAFALASSAVMVAAALDGFALPAVAQQWTEADKIAGDDIKRLVRFCVLTASSLTRIYLLLGSIAIALWSWVIHRDRLDSALPWVGSMACIAGIAMLIGGSPFISAHEVLALVTVQTVWMLLAAVLMIRKRPAPEQNDVAMTAGSA
jgi:hypothetical protein